MPLLASMENWERSAYGKAMPLVNEKTLQSLRHFFTTYSNAPTSEPTISASFKTAVKKVFHKDCNNVDFTATLTRSFGILAPHSFRIANDHTRKFWEFEVADDRPKSTLCNPLFVYSSRGGEKFAVDSGSNPLAIYHLAANLPDLSSGSPFPRRSSLARVVAGARKQFSDRCSAFQQFVKKDGRIDVRFAVADPIAFCFAL
jgi:hypothetical protein